MIKKTFKVPIYNSKVTVILDKDLSYVEKKYNTNSLSNYGAVTLKDETKYKKYIVAFEHISDGIIVHEVVHLVNYIFLDCGVELDRVNDEHQAYFTAWLFRKINKICKK